MSTLSKSTCRACKVFLAFVASCLTFGSLLAQEDLSDLTLDELGHVKINQKSAGILENVPYNPSHIYLGLVVPYSREKEHSLEIKRAVDLAIGEINAAGGVIGRQLHLVTADDADINELTVLYTDSLIRRYKISALIGPTSSRRLIHLATTYLPQHPVLVISPSASSAAISTLDDNDLVWRTTPSDAAQAKLAAQYAFNDLGLRSAGVLYIQDVYGTGLDEEFKKNFKGKVLSEVSYSPRVDLNTFDLTAKFTTLFKDKPELIYLVAGSDDAAMITHMIMKGKYITDAYKPAIFGVDAIRQKDFIERSDKKFVDGMCGTAVASNNNEIFRNSFYQKYGKNPVSPYCESAYDITYILALAIEKSKSVNYTDIKNELRNVTGSGVKIRPNDFTLAIKKINKQQDIYFEGASGKISFDQNGDLTHNRFEVWRIGSGKYQTLKVLSSD